MMSSILQESFKRAVLTAAVTAFMVDLAKGLASQLLDVAFSKRHTAEKDSENK